MVFAPNPSRTRGKAWFLPAFPVDPGGARGGRTLARAVMHFEDVLGALTRRGGLHAQRGGLLSLAQHSPGPAEARKACKIRGFRESQAEARKARKIRAF